MQAIGIAHFGDQPHLIEWAPPAPEAGELEVEMFAASRNPLDDAVAAGYLAGLGEFRFPLALGFDGAGVVRRVGAGVEGFSAADRVFGQFWSSPMQFGTFAELAIVQARPALGALGHVPDGVSFTDAAAAPTAAMTAAGALDNSGARTGDTVLILGATGGVGTFAIQEAKARGIRVIAAAHPDAAHALLELGADQILPRDASFADALADFDRDAISALLDFTGATGSVDTAARAVRDGGTVVSTARGVPDSLRSQNRVRAMDYVLDAKPARLHRLADSLAAATIRPVIGRETDLESAMSQPAPSDHGLRGKTVIRLR